MLEIFLIFLFAISSIVWKSLNEKREIERKKASEAGKDTGLDTKTLDDNIEEPQTINFEDIETYFDDSGRKKEEYPLETFQNKKSGYGKPYDLQVEILKEEKKDYNRSDKTKKTYKAKKRYKTKKEDLIRGFIFSEVLAEPKSIKNMRRR